MSSSSWRSHLTSGVVHIAVITLLFAVTFPFIHEVERARHIDNVTLIAPRTPAYQPKISPRAHIKLPQVIAKNEIRPKPVPVIKPVEVRPVPTKPLVVAAAPEVRAVVPVSSPHVIAEPKFDVPAPKPEVHTGSFESASAAKAPQTQKTFKVGGFGDPNGATASPDSRPSASMLAKVGSFDMPQGAGNAGGGGRSESGSVHPASFGSVGDNGGSLNGSGHGSASVHTGAFGESAIANPQLTPLRSKSAEPATTPVEILSKPKPVYTEEARDLKLEGQVSLEVLFLSNGSMRVVRVLHGLGHGLDEAAEQAAMQVRFRPAMRGGVPVDTSATIHITFQLT